MNAPRRPDYLSQRGYSAQVVARTPELVLYHAWDDDGERIQTNGSRAPADFDRDWRPS